MKPLYYVVHIVDAESGDDEIDGPYRSRALAAKKCEALRKKLGDDFFVNVGAIRVHSVREIIANLGMDASGK